MTPVVRFAAIALSVLIAIGARAGVAEAAETVASPSGAIVVTLDVAPDGAPIYSAAFNGETVVKPSRLGFRFRDQPAFDQGFALAGAERATHDATWEQPWGERRVMRDRHNELAVAFAEADGEGDRAFTLRVRVFDDGFAFRYELPKSKRYKTVDIMTELTEFALDQDATAWWTPADGFNRYEYIYRTTRADEMSRAMTPVTFRTKAGVHLSIHEAALVDYASMSLDMRRPAVFRAHMHPRSDGSLVRKTAPFTTPWRTVQIAPDAKGLLNSTMILNLNEPNALGDVSWVETGKYIGIWWAMHINERTWGSGPVHGATTEETKRYIDFAAEHGFIGVLVEGWNIGWDGDWFNNGDLFNFTEAYPDFDIKAVTDYAREKGVRLIGHHETSGAVTNYERQMADAFDLYEAMGVRTVKTGYVADAGDIKRVDDKGVAKYEWHDGQFMSNHHLRVVQEAAKRKIAINAHEPIKDTGLRRTYPNWVSREGARGMEFNAWGSPPNPPEHEAVLAYTRMLAGPMDFTPGIFDLRPNERPPVRPDVPRGDPKNFPQTTLAKQLALYVVIYSPIQMAADLPENYEARPDAFQFIKDVPADWEDSVAVAGAVGDFVVQARKARGGDDWFLGALTDEEPRTVSAPLGFLDEGVTYEAQIYRDGAKAHYLTNPYDFVVETKTVTSNDVLTLKLGASGGAAVRFTPKAAAE